LQESRVCTFSPESNAPKAVTDTTDLPQLSVGPKTIASSVPQLSRGSTATTAAQDVSPGRLQSPGEAFPAAEVTFRPLHSSDSGPGLPFIHTHSERPLACDEGRIFGHCITGHKCLGLRTKIGCSDMNAANQSCLHRLTATAHAVRNNRDAEKRWSAIENCKHGKQAYFGVMYPPR